MKIEINGKFTRKAKVRVKTIRSVYPKGDRDTLSILLFQAMRSDKDFAEVVRAADILYSVYGGKTDKQIKNMSAEVDNTLGTLREIIKDEEL